MPESHPAHHDDVTLPVGSPHASGLRLDSDGELAEGAAFGKYRILRILGRGGNGVVYEAEDDLLGRSVALKVLSAPLRGDPQTMSRFRAEAKSAAKVTHPNIVGVYEFGASFGRLYLSMELVRGGTAADFVHSRGAFNWPEATRVIADVARGLGAAHAAGMIHRDIKPANIMRAFDGTVKLADFGLAKAVDIDESLTREGTLLGTPSYMSPEQCRGRVADPRSDIYSLGGAYYALLTGRPPYHEVRDPMAVMYAHCSQPVPDPRDGNPDLPARCAAVVARAMAKDPDERYASAAAMCADLENILPKGARHRRTTGARPVIVVPAPADTAPTQALPAPATPGPGEDFPDEDSAWGALLKAADRASVQIRRPAASAAGVANPVAAGRASMPARGAATDAPDSSSADAAASSPRAGSGRMSARPGTRSSNGGGDVPPAGSGKHAGGARSMPADKSATRLAAADKSAPRLTASRARPAAQAGPSVPWVVASAVGVVISAAVFAVAVVISSRNGDPAATPAKADGSPSRVDGSGDDVAPAGDPAPRLKGSASGVATGIPISDPGRSDPPGKAGPPDATPNPPSAKPGPTFLADWMIIGPVTLPAGGDPLGSPHPLDAVPTGEHTFAGPDGHVTWHNRTAAPDGYVDLLADSPPVANMLAMGVCVVDNPREMQARIRTRHDDGLRVWVNDREVYTRDRHTPEEVLGPVFTLPAGRSTVRIRLVQVTDTWGFVIRLLGEDGRTIPGLTSAPLAARFPEAAEPTLTPAVLVPTPRPVIALTAAARADRFAAVAEGGDVMVFDAAGTVSVRWSAGTNPHATAVSLRSDGTALAFGDVQGRIRVIGMPGAQPLYQFNGPSAAVAQLTFSADGRLLVSRTVDGQVSFRAADDARLRGLEARFRGLTLLPSGDALLVTDPQRLKVLKLGDAAVDPGNGASKVPDKAGPPGKAAPEDGAPMPAANKDDAPPAKDFAGRLRVGTQLRLPLPLTEAWLSPDGTLLATSWSHSSEVRLWEFGTGKRLATLSGHVGPGGHRVAFAPDGRLMATTGAYGPARLWRTSDGRSAGTLKLPAGHCRGAAFSADGRRLAIGTATGVAIFDLPPGP